MSGEAAARITDKVKGGKIITGSRTVLIGSQGGLACSECPGGITVSSPVNPQLGAKVLLGAQDLDFALPGAMPVVWQRQYSSYVNRAHGAACGLLGHGWHLIHEVRIELQEDASLLFDAAGRVITFDEALLPGGQLYSASENIWLMRGGSGEASGTAPWASRARWRHIEHALACDPEIILAASGDATTLWCFAPPHRLQANRPGNTPANTRAAATNTAATAVIDTTHSLHGPWRLLAQIDRLGRSQRYHYSDGSQSQSTSEDTMPAGRLIALTDGVGRRYRLLHQRIHRGKPAQVPQGQSGAWGADDGWRLIGVELEHDPLAPLHSPLALVRYAYNARGDLAQVRDRAGELVREFEWNEHRISAHRHAHGPWHSYRYESTAPGARVVEHSNEEGLSYQFEYLKQPASPEGVPRAATRVRDSLGRIQTYHFEGVPGLSRLTVHERADGSIWRYEYDGFGHLAASTDPLGRCTRIRRDAQGRITGEQLPAGGSSASVYDEVSGRLLHTSGPGDPGTAYEYDSFGRLIQITQAGSTAVRYRYPEPQEHRLHCDSPASIEDARGGLKRLAWSDAGQLLSYTDCSGHSTYYHYDRWGALVETINALGQHLRHERDAQGRIVATQHTGGQTERYHYYRAGRLMRIEPAGQGQTDNARSDIDLSYDLWGRLTRRSYGGLALAFEYDAAGRLERLVNENGAQSRFAWDTQDRLVQEEGFDGRLQRYDWDAAGQLIAAHDGNAQTQACTRYHWDEGGRLVARELPATAQIGEQMGAQMGAQIHRYEWDAAGRMLAASVWQSLQQDGEHNSGEQNRREPAAWLQSRIELQRDPLGRITGEIQRLYKPVLAPGMQPNMPPTPQSGTPTAEIEFQHHIAHRLDALGNRQGSSLQGMGEIAWLLYGSGHVHGLEHNGHSLIDLERDSLHRETRRSLQAAAGTPLLHIQRQWDALGRLQSLATQGLQSTAQLPQLPQLLVGQLAQRRYHYDALGQLIGIEQGLRAGPPAASSAQLLRYGYDAAGRLRAMADSAQPNAIDRWELDAAGNRLPARPLQGQTPAPEQDWAAQVHAHWQHSEFNLLGQGHPPAHSIGPVRRWPDNRIGYSQEAAWRYDSCGNRVEQLHSGSAVGDTAKTRPSHRTRQQLHYDGGHQLVQVCTTNEGDAPERISCYTYDALGRRLKKETTQSSADGAASGQQPQTSYFGWDGDRLVHTEHVDIEERVRRHITHTIYEPHTFTPMVRLSTTGSALQDKPHALVQALQAGLDDPGQEERQALALVQDMLSALPKEMQTDAAEVMQQVLAQGLPKSAIQLLGDEGETTAQRLTHIREQLQKQEQSAQTPIKIEYYHCDHLGTPMALTDQQGRIAWAAKLDPWGNVQEEYNPGGIEQPIRLPGQHHDRETGLYYNRHRYYDPAIGSYINQDPIGIKGGFHGYRYAQSPLIFFDALGLQTISATDVPLPGPTPGAVDMRPDGKAWGEGCGDAKTDKYIPDSYFGKADFMLACGAHDDCYGTWGADKNQCDDKLYEDMKASCDKANNQGNIGAPGLCKAQAWTYKFILKDANMGQSAYDAAQEEAFWKMIDGKMRE